MAMDTSWAVEVRLKDIETSDAADPWRARPEGWPEIGWLSDSIVHHLRNPVGTIYAGAEMLMTPRAPRASGTTMTAPTPTCNGTGNDETALIHKIVGGQRDLFGDLIAPHLTMLSRMVRATIGGHPEVEDIVQQTAVKAFTHLAQFRFEAGFRTWLIQIGLNEARQWRRKYVSSPFLELTPAAFSELPIADQNHSPLIEYQRSETGAQLRAALDRLPEKYRNVILLRDVEDLSISEVAVRLGLTIPAVKTRHRRARQKVAGFLERSRKFRPGVARTRPQHRTALGQAYT